MSQKKKKDIKDQIKIDNKFMPIVSKIFMKYKKLNLKAYWNTKKGKSHTIVNIFGDKELVEKFKEEILASQIRKLKAREKYWYTFIEKNYEISKNMVGYRHALLDYNIKEDLYKIELNEDENPREYYQAKMYKLMNDLVPFNDNGLYLFIVYKDDDKDDDKNYAYIQFNYEKEDLDTIFDNMIKVENHESETMTKKMNNIYNNVAAANYAVYKRNNLLKINETEKKS